MLLYKAVDSALLIDKPSSISPFKADKNPAEIQGIKEVQKLEAIISFF